MRLKTIPEDSSSSSPMVLLAESGTSRRPSNPQVKSLRPCFNFAKGSCLYGSDCHYLHDATSKPAASSSRHSSHTTQALLIKLLDKLGVNDIGQTRDFLTRRVLLRCDSTGDLYPVTSPSPIPHAFLCDHGGEFDNRALHKLFVENGIQFWFSCAHTSQQNGKSERMIRTLNNLIRTLLFQANLPPTFWVEALNMAVYLLNILPSTAIANEVPYTRLFGTHPDYNLLRTFGCLCYPHAYTSHKLEPRATPSIFLGHATNHCGYRCFDLNTKQIIISRHVTFDETVFPYGTNTTTTPTTYTFLDDIPDIPPIILPTLQTTQPNITPSVTDIPHEPTSPPPSNSPTHQSLHSPSTAQQTSSSHAAQTTPPTTHQSLAHTLATAQSPSPLPATAQTTSPPLYTIDQPSVIIPNPPTNPNPDSVHHMVTRYRVGSNRPPARLTFHVSSVSPLPKSYRDAFNDLNWQNAMCDEYHALIKNNTWTLVPRPANTNIVRCMWLFRHKYHADGTLSRYKARLVANGSTQLEGVDVDETFSPVVKPGTIRTVLSLAASRHWPIHQLDVKNAFLHGDLSETVYMHQPPGFRDSAHPDYVCLLQRSLYGLKQAPRAWFQRFSSYITRVSFHHSRCDSSLFIYGQGTDTAYFLLYVDDIVLTASSQDLLQHIIRSLHQEFSMTDLGSLNYFLGISVTWDSSGIFLSQKKYALEILERAGMVHCNSSRTPVDIESKLGDTGDVVSNPTLYRSLAGSLQYLTFTRPDISYAVQQRTKHIEIDIHFVLDLVTTRQVRVLHVPSRFQFADIFTKGLPSALFEEFRTSLSVRCPSAPTAGEC
ncbi:ribonuclease H-like domain-containing protein [Tanacetum coccineum]